MKPYYDEAGITIYHGDCRELLPQLPAGTVRLTFTSPPYNLCDRGFFAIARHHNVTFKPGAWRSRLVDGYGSYGDAMPFEQYRQWQQQMLTEMWRLLTDDGAIYYNHKPRVLDGEVRLPTELNPGLPLRQVIIWDRVYPGVNATFTQYTPGVEWVLLFAKPSFRLLNMAASGVGDIWRVPAGNTTERRGNTHPAAFPIALPMKALATTPPGVVLDPFMGSGTTLRAAKDLGRRAIGIELEERYCEVAAKRLGQEVLDFADA